MSRETADFDVAAFAAAMEEKRRREGLSWRGVADALWDLSWEINQRRDDHPISPSTLVAVARRGDTTCQHALFILRWLERTPESFVKGRTADPERDALPFAGPDRRLRWRLGRLYEAMDERRRAEGLSWFELAEVLRCSPHQLRGVRTAKYAIGMRLAMRITLWLERPAADFVEAARW